MIKDDAIYTGETVTCYLLMWDAETTPATPITSPSEITLTVRDPTGATESKSLTAGEVGATSTDGEYRARFVSGSVAGTYDLLWIGTTHDGHVAISADKVRVRERPF